MQVKSWEQRIFISLEPGTKVSGEGQRQREGAACQGAKSVRNET